MNMTDAIVVKDVTKRFRLHPGGARTLKSVALDILKARGGSRQFEALRQISFSVPRGETMGIIGSNGAGKSTLLSLIAGTMFPTSGSIQTQGSISSLLELGAGFHPDLTGRENVLLYGAIMGISRKRMLERFESIADFAGIGEYMDQPVKHYSSGMYVRLAFSVAVEVDPDILLIDEVLAVGDVTFQRKCIEKMNEFRRRGKTMLMVSHDLRTIQSISDRILILDFGQVIGMGGAESMVSEYRKRGAQQGADGISREWGIGGVRITDVVFRNKAGETATTFSWGEPMDVVIQYEATQRIERPVFGFSISDKSGTLIYGNNTQIERFEIPSIMGKGALCLHIERVNMSAGTYSFSMAVHSEDHKTNYHRLDNCFPVSIVSDKSFEGVCHMPCKWQMEAG